MAKVKTKKQEHTNSRVHSGYDMSTCTHKGLMFSYKA